MTTRRRLVPALAQLLLTSLLHATAGAEETGAQAAGKIPRIGLLGQAVDVPKISRVAFLSNPANPGNTLSAREFDEVARSAGLKVQFVTARDPEELKQAIENLGHESREVIIVAWDALIQAHAKEIGDIAIRRRLPTLTPIKEYVEAGVLMSYGANLPEQWKRAARYVDRILKRDRKFDFRRQWR